MGKVLIVGGDAELEAIIEEAIPEAEFVYEIPERPNPYPFFVPDYKRPRRQKPQPEMTSYDYRMMEKAEQKRKRKQLKRLNNKP